MDLTIKNSVMDKKAMTIRVMEKSDLETVAKAHELAFLRQTLSKEWLTCALNAFPRNLCYLVEESESVGEQGVLGYIIWGQKSGFRPEVVLELEQIAVLPTCQGQGIGQALITESLNLVREHLALRDAKVKHILVSTRADNHAQSLYKKVLGAKVEATIENLFSADEVYMVARDV
jgi:ribosomal protein S18 acetylase RimI-like enzyme